MKKRYFLQKRENYERIRYMKYTSYKNHIRVFYDARFEQFIGKASSASTVIKDSGKHIKEDAKGIFGIITSGESFELAKLMLRTKNKIDEAEKSNNQTVKKVLELLRATGIIEEGIVSKARILKRFDEGSGKSGALAIINALEEAEKGNINIVTYANKEYKSQNIKQYEATVKANPEQINTGVSKGLWDLYSQKNDLGFLKETWSSISVYCAKKNWDTKIIGNESMKSGMMRIYSERKSVEENNLNNILKEQLPNIQINDPRLAELLTKTKLKINPNGTINAEAAIAEMKISNINQIPLEFKNLADTLKKEANELFQKAKEIARSSNIKSLSEINIPGIGKGDVLNRPFESFKEEEIRKYLPMIQDYLKTVQDPIKKTELNKIVTILLARQRAFENTRLAADAKQKAKSASQVIKSNPNITIEQVGIRLNSEIEQQKAIFAQEVAVSRTATEHQLETLEEHGINTLEKAQSKLKELVIKEQKGTLSREDTILKSKLIGYIQSKIQEAQIYQNFGSQFTENEKREIFIDTNRFISGNEKESYNFQALDKIATLTDPESTPGQKSLARLEPGQSIAMSKALEGEMTDTITNAPELNQVNISKNQDGTYNIPLFNARNLSDKQVDEYKESTKLYAELGLSQFIPHIPLINAELRKKGIDATVDGQVSTTEQQKILKVLYSKLFGKEIISSNLGEVERAYASALGNPTNMKSAMQHTLSIHNLISGSGQAISTDRLKNWFKETTKNESIDPLKNLTF